MANPPKYLFKFMDNFHSYLAYKRQTLKRNLFVGGNLEALGEY